LECELRSKHNDERSSSNLGYFNLCVFTLYVDAGKETCTVYMLRVKYGLNRVNYDGVVRLIANDCDMLRNVEIKAKVRNLDDIVSKAKKLSNSEGTCIEQDDVFFKVSQGRLKLRTFEVSCRNAIQICNFFAECRSYVPNKQGCVCLIKMCRLL
jgi:hypothetical protein